MPSSEEETVSLIFYDPLASIVGGGTDKMAQLGAAHCILQLFAYFYKENNSALLGYFFPKFLHLFIVSTRIIFTEEPM